MLWRKAALAGSLAPGRGGQRSTAQQHTAASKNEKTERVEPASKTSKKERRNAQKRLAGMVKLCIMHSAGSSGRGDAHGRTLATTRFAASSSSRSLVACSTNRAFFEWEGFTTACQWHTARTFREIWKRSLSLCKDKHRGPTSGFKRGSRAREHCSGLLCTAPPPGARHRQKGLSPGTESTQLLTGGASMMRAIKIVISQEVGCCGRGQREGGWGRFPQMHA